jgi:hypothetical protein
METRYSEAIDYFVDSSRVFAGQNSHSAIVLHATAGPATWSAQQLGDYFRTTSAETSSHFGIDRAGVVCQYVSLADGAAANCCVEPGHDTFWDQFGGDNLNLHTISIEHVNDDVNGLALSPAQQAASFKLVTWLCQQYGLGPDQIKTHASIDPANRAHCPGPAFPLDELKSFISNGGSMHTYTPGKGDFDSWFVDNGDGTWTCKEHNTVLRGALIGFYATLSVDGSSLPLPGLPIESEQLHTEADGYQWWSQECERATMICDPKNAKDGQPGMKDCYLAHVNPPQVQIVEKISDTLKADIKALPAFFNGIQSASETLVAKLMMNAGIGS